ncbi:SigE family RNA polymerase sigma factor [Micromonospora sp. ALFpr18c]|uniref:SigE family RNA polymerase sigma factor n=1 Tax=unclassified Micromonospora TaxID=2617518 RepID=UPI00124B7E94|nr:SigE family RNA polymerase sigma factor [Micromonospora sp. ALFpr18c]KAB1922060.1 SigE family RNA polymerase sigma factor [Micromonospora sp. ALFpr18c]
MAGVVNEVEFEAFVQASRAWLRHEAYYICGDWHVADDLVQVALCKLYQRWDRLSRRAALGAYARRVILRSYLSERRRLRWRCEVVALATVDIVSSEDPQSAVDDRQMLLKALRRLGPRQRSVVMLRFLDDLSVEQTARALGCAPATVTSQTARALSALRRALSS